MFGTRYLHPTNRFASCMLKSQLKSNIHPIGRRFSPPMLLQQNNYSTNHNSSQWTFKPKNNFAYKTILGVAFATLGYHLLSQRPDNSRASNEVIIDEDTLFPIKKHLKLSPQLIAHRNEPEMNIEFLIPKVDLFSIGGHREALKLLSDIIYYLQDSTKFKEMGSTAPNTILLSGPPGVGKSYLAEAVAGHANVPFFMISASEFREKHVGDSEKKLREYFKKAKEVAPCVVCLDEIDSIGLNRSIYYGKGSTHSSETLNQLLTLLSEEHPNVVIFATTNYPELLDPALTRDGRFDRRITLSLPNRQERLKLLEIYTNDKTLANDVSLEDLAAVMTGSSGANIKALMNESALCAIKHGETAISIKHIEEARSLITMGLPGEPCSDIQSKRCTAIHESGHALVAYLINFQIYKVSVKKYGNAYGSTELIPRNEETCVPKQQLLDQICYYLSGRAAEEVFGIPQSGSESDIQRAKSLAQSMVFKEGMGRTLLGRESDVNEILIKEFERAKQLLNQNRNSLNRVIDALVEFDELHEAQFNAVVKNEKIERSKNPKNPIDSDPFVLPPKSTSPIKKPEPINKVQPGARKVASVNKSPLVDKIDFSKEEPVPFTKKQIATAFGVEESDVRKLLRYNNGYELVFIPTFDKKNKIYDACRIMHKYGVDHLNSEPRNRIYIWFNGLEDFHDFMKDHGG